MVKCTELTNKNYIVKHVASENVLMNQRDIRYDAKINDTKSTYIIRWLKKNESSLNTAKFNSTHLSSTFPFPASVVWLEPNACYVDMHLDSNKDTKFVLH